jgi:hypothetical protein
MADKFPIDLSKVIKKTAPLDDLVADELKNERGKFNLTEEQWKDIGDGRLFGRRASRRRVRRTAST